MPEVGIKDELKVDVTGGDRCASMKISQPTKSSTLVLLTVQRRRRYPTDIVLVLCLDRHHPLSIWNVLKRPRPVRSEWLHIGNDQSPLRPTRKPEVDL